MNIGIVGLGLMGGSMAKSIKARTCHGVWGTDIKGETMTLARLCGAIDGQLTDENLGLCDLLFIALRPGEAVLWVQKNAEKISKSTPVIDLCGIKRAVVEKITPMGEKYGFKYIGGHPMAGRERSGFTASTEDLFQGASMILTPDKNTDMKDLEMLKAFFTDIGFANLTCTTPHEHDRIIAFTSQLAHIVSGAYVKSPTALEQRGFSAGSFRDMTRVARLDEEMWTELFSENSDYLCSELDTLIANLREYSLALKSGDKKALCRLLKEGRERKEAVGGN